MWHHDVNKPVTYNIHKDIKPRHYLDPFLKTKAYVPAPTSYNIAKGFEHKRNTSMVSKSPRITHAEQMINQVKKDKFPDVGTYKKNYTS